MFFLKLILIFTNKYYYTLTKHGVIDILFKKIKKIFIKIKINKRKAQLNFKSFINLKTCDDEKDDSIYGIGNLVPLFRNIFKSKK